MAWISARRAVPDVMSMHIGVTAHLIVCNLYCHIQSHIHIYIYTCTHIYIYIMLHNNSSPPPESKIEEALCSDMADRAS